MWARFETATVIAIENKSETDIYSHGGGGYVDPKFGGKIQAPSISSVTTHITELFVKRNSDGKEESIVLFNNEVPIRVGANLAFAFGSPKNESTGDLLFIANLDTGSCSQFGHAFRIDKEEAQREFLNMDTLGAIHVAPIITLLASLIIAAIFNWFILFFGIIAVVSVWILKIRKYFNILSDAEQKRREDFSNLISKKAEDLGFEVSVEIKKDGKFDVTSKNFFIRSVTIKNK